MEQQDTIDTVEECNEATDTVKPAKVKKRIIIMIWDYIVEFLNTSSVHGLNHLTKFQRHPVELILWLIIMCTCVFGTLYLTATTWIRYQSSPTVVSVDRDMFAWNTTFPGVTICPKDKISEDKLKEYIRHSKEQNKTLLENFIRSLFYTNFKTFHEIPDYRGLPSTEYMELITNLSKPLYYQLSIGTRGVNLSLTPTITEMGLCHSLNSMTAAYNSPDYRRSNKWDQITDINETFVVHPLDGEVSAQLTNLSTGYDMYIHGPLEVPDITAQAHSSDKGYFMKLYVNVVMIYTSAEATSLSMKQRKCRFPYENTLKHNSIYSYNLCRMECRIKMCKELCHCVPHFYRALANETTCDVKGLHCIAHYEKKLFHLRGNNTNKHYCECLPLCDDASYVLQDKILQKWFLETNIQWGVGAYPRFRFRREIIFGFTDVLVSAGGMAGLFLGCSLLSLVEIIYYMTLRLFWYLAHLRKEHYNN